LPHDRDLTAAEFGPAAAGETLGGLGGLVIRASGGGLCRRRGGWPRSRLPHAQRRDAADNLEGLQVRSP
jgi:hypothetical protein